ncbi:Heparanase [Trachymyrmex septentrionalis]|uniref:Heparanase n=1 Tax=Trachymyrmex septentrionalis TaxID=34720 RepID=A0A195FKG2_9HYME|nr:Heparanase [Trachymyrmex septentrionalis]
MKYHRQYVCLLLQVIFFISNCLAENLILNINVKKPIAVTDRAFLSFTLDPATLQYNDFIKNIEKSMNLARGLTPAYIRLGGPQSNFYNFGQVYSHEINTDRNDMHFGTQWTLIYQWAKNTGLDVIACITPHYIDKEFKTDSTDPRNIAELLSFSDRMGYNISWQLGYECQTRCDLSGEELGRYVANFHEILKTFPRYSNSLITGPDIVAYRMAYQQKYLQDYLHSASAALSAITWHPNLDIVSLNNNSISIYYDNMIAEKNELFKIINSAEKKPLWIAESKSQENKHQYLGALIWMRRLGDAAKLGIQVVMRQLTNLSQATPAYWVSLLYKTLVGREVLEIKLQSNNENYVHFYSHCTKPSALYSKGAVTIFGINLTPETVTTNLKGLKIKILHKYILLPEFETTNKMFSEKVLLNNKPLNLINDKNLPNIYPEIIINPDGLELELPSGGIGFWIIPSAKVKACTCSEEEIIENNTVKKLSKRHENSIQQSNQEEEDINQLNLKNKKIYDKQDSKKQENVKNIKNESQQRVWNSKLFEKIKKILQKRLQKTDKNESSQRSFTINLRKQENSSEEEQDLDKKNFKRTEINDKFKNIQDLLKKYKRILLEKKTVMETRNIQYFKLEIENIDNVVTLISKIDAFILYKITSKEPDTSEIEDKTKNEREEESIIKINKKLKEYLSELENSVEIKTNIITKIKKYFNKLYNLLEYNDSTNDNKNNQVHEYLIEQKKFRRHLDKKSENSQKNNILEKRSRINNLKDYAIKQKLQKIKQKNSDNIDNLKTNFINNKNKYNNHLQQDPVTRRFKSNAFENANRHIDNQHVVQEYNKIKNNNIYRKHSKIGDMEKYQNLIQGPERIKRDIKELVEIDLRRDSASEKHSRDDLTNYVNERKMKLKDDIRRELLRPFNPRTDSNENNFHDFFRRDPVKGFPEGDIFVTAEDSLEQNDEGYDYVKDKNDCNDSSKKNTQHSQKSELDYAKDNTWIEEIKDDHCDYMPNKFFENIKLSNMKIKENSKNYDDLGEAEFLSKVHNTNNNDNDNKIAITEVIQKQPLNKENKRHIKETRIQRLVHHYDDLKKQEYNQDTLQSVSRYPSTYNYNDNYQTSSKHYDILKDKNGFDKNIDSNDNIHTKASEYSTPNTYAEHSIYNKIFHNKRNKRDNWEKLRKLFVEEMIQEDEENAKDCHCRVIRDSDSPKKRNISVIPITKVIDTSSENKNMSANVAQFQNDLAEEEYQKIMAGEILSSTSEIDPDYEETDTTTKSVITELRTLDHKLSETTEAIDVTSILGLDNVSKQYHKEKKSITNLLPVDSDSKLPPNNNSVKYITKKMFFRTQLPDIQSENKTKTYDSFQIISKISSENKDPREKCIISTTSDAQKTTLHNEKVQELINKKKKSDNSIYPTITEDQKNKKGHNNDCEIELKSTNFLKETTKGIVEQVTTKTILLKRAANTAIDNTKSNESITKSKLLQNTEDNQNSESVWMQLGKDANTRKLKNILQNLPRTSLEGLTKYEKSFTKRTERIDKLKEKLYARREKLLQQNQNELMKIADEEKRNLKRREAWERLRGSDDFQLIDPKFIGILLDDDVTYKDDDVTYEDDNESCLILIMLIPKQYKNIIDQIYLPEETKKVHYPEYNKYYQVLRNLIDDDEELVETSKSSEFFDREDNQDCRYSSNTIEDEQGSTETASRLFDQKVFIIDPSTYYGGEPILQQDDVKLPKYQSKIKSQIQYPRWTLRDIHEILTKLKSSKSQHQVSKSQEYIEKLPIKDYYNQEHSNSLHVLDKQKQYNLSKKLAALVQELLISLYQRDVNQASNKEADKLNDMHKNLKTDKDNLNSMFAINKTKFIRSFEIERNIENTEFDSSNNRKKDIMNSETNENAEDVVKTKKTENIEMIKHEKINKSYSNSNDKAENLNITMFNNNKTVEHVENIIKNNPNKKELGEKNLRLPENTIKDLNNIQAYLKEDSIKKIFDKQPMKIYLLTKNGRSSNADLFPKLKNYLISSQKNFKVNQQNRKEYDLNYVTLTPIEIKNIFEILDTKNNDDSMELFEILQWDDQYVLEIILNSIITEYLNDKTSEEFEYEDPSNLQSENSEIFLDEENYINENEQDITAKDSEIESEKDEQYKITNDEINKFLKIKNQVEPKREMFLLLPWSNVKIRQQRQIKSEVNEDVAEIKREVTEDHENKRTKRHYLNNNIDKEEENMIEIKRVNYLQPETKNRDNLFKDFIKACKKNNLYNNEASSVKNETKNKSIPLNNISKSDKKILQKEMPRLQNHMESVEEFINDSEENFNDTLANKDKHFGNRTFGTTDNVFYTAIMNLKDLFAFLPNISRLSTILPYPSLYNDEHLIKDNSKRSLILLMPVRQTQNEHEKSKEMVQKTKRCDTRRRNRFLLLSTKENNNRTRTANKNINVGTFQQNSNDHTTKNTKYSQKNSATSKRMVAATNEDKTLLRSFNDNLNAKDVTINLKFPEKAKKCNTEKYICHCEEDCSSSSSKESSSKILGSSKDKPERINHQRLTKHKNAKANILQQQSPKLYHENPYELPFSNLINYFPIQSYPEKMNIPPVPILYGITPNVLSHMVGNEGKYVDVGIPFIPFQDRQNYLVENNQDQSVIHKKPCICSPVITDSVESSMSVTNSPSTDYVDVITSKETTNDLESNNPIGVTEEDQEHSPKLTTEVPNIDASADSETETNLNYLTDATEEDDTISPSNLKKIVQKSNDFTEQTERNLDDLFKSTTYSVDDVDTSSVPFVTNDITNDGKFINMEECIKLFGRDVCVLTTDPYFASESSTNEISKSNVNVNEYLESTSIKPNADIEEASLRQFHPESTKQISKSDINYDKNTPFNTVKNTHTSIKKLMDPTIDKTTTTGKRKLLGKSKNHKTKLLLNPNDEKIINPTSSEKVLYFTPSYESNSDEEANNSKINQQNQVTKSNSNTSQEETTTVISCDFKSDPKKQDRNCLKESNTNIYSKKKTPQEHFEEETTTSSNSKTKDNFVEEIKKEIIGIETSIKPEEVPQEQSTTMQYFNDKKLSNLNNKESTTNNIKTIDSSTNKLPFCDNTLLLNSIRKVINDFTSNTRLTKTKDFDENILQTQGKNLLPEILQVPNLKDILSMPQIENTIVDKVKDVLSYVTAIPRKDFTNDWSHGVIKNTLHSILGTLSGFHHKLSPMMLEEHQFKDGQWKTNLVTLAPILNQKLSIAIPKNLRESIKELLNSPAIASQIDQNIVRNIIVQSVKNNLSNDKDDEIDDLIIHALNDILQMSKNSEDTLEQSNEIISDEADMDMINMQEISTSNYKIENNIDNSILNSKQNLDVKKQDTKIDNKEIHTTDNQKAKKLENNANILTISEFPQILHLYEKKEKEESTNEDKIKEDIRDQTLKKIDGQDDAEKEIAESLKPKIIYHKAILQNNLGVLEPNSTEAGQYTKNHPIDKESNKETITIRNFIQKTPNYVSDNKILENIVVGAKDVEEKVNHTLNGNTLTATTNNIDPLIILERIKFNFPPIKYYSPEILKYATNRIDDKNVEITTAPMNFIQKSLSNYTQDDMPLQNTAETKDENKIEYLTTTDANLISSTNEEYRPRIISLTDNILEPQQQNLIENNIIKIHEVTTEIQRTYAKTTYFKAGLSGDDSSRTNSPSLTGETTNISINNDNENSNGNSDNDNNNLINKINNNEDIAKAKKVIVSSSKSAALNDIYSAQLFPSSIASDDISELQKSQLYYINDGVKLPLEIKRLEDGSYALLISKNVCEQILTRKCPCCVPLQGHIIRSSKNHQQDVHAMTTNTEKKDQENILGSNSFPFQPSNTATRRNALRIQNLKKEKEEKEINNEHHLWKPNDDNFAMISMPVIDFAKKYNLLLDFNEERVLLNKTELQNKILNYKSIVNSVEGFKHQELKLSEVENTNNVQNVNIVNSENQGNPVLKEINISEESKMSKEEEKSDKLLDTAEENFRGNIGKPYRYQRNANYVENKRTELVKSMLYWLKGLFVDN